MKTKTATNAEYRAAAALLLLAAFLALHLGRCSASKADAESIVTGFTNEEDLMQLFAGLSEKNSPEIFLDMNVETTADFLNVTRQTAGEATLAQFLDVKGDASGVASALAITRESVQSCAPDENVFAVLKAREGNLGRYDFGLTVSALQSTGISNLLEAAPEGEDFKAYALVAPTDDAWRKLKQRLQEDPSAASEALPLQSLLTYQVYGENNETNFNAIKDVINGTFLEDAPFSFFINVPIDMVDGNATVLSTGSAATVPPELNGSPILAIEPACNGVVLVLDDVLLPGAAVEEYMKPPQDAGGAAAAGQAEAAAAGDHGDACTDAVPPAPLGTQWTCEDQKYWGKCQQYWMWAGDYCRKTCEFCGKAEFPYALATGAAASGPEASAEQSR